MRMTMRKMIRIFMLQDWREQQLPRLQILLSPSFTFSEEPSLFMDTGQHYQLLSLIFFTVTIIPTLGIHIPHHDLLIDNHQVLCPSKLSDPVFPVQEHRLLHRTGNSWKGTLYIMLWAEIAREKRPNDFRFSGVLHVLLKLQRSGINFSCCVKRQILDICLGKKESNVDLWNVADLVWEHFLGAIQHHLHLHTR